MAVIVALEVLLNCIPIACLAPVVSDGTTGVSNEVKSVLVLLMDQALHVTPADSVDDEVEDEVGMNSTANSHDHHAHSTAQRGAFGVRPSCAPVAQHATDIRAVGGC